MGFETREQGVSADVPSWRLKASSNSWRRRESPNTDSGYESASSQSGSSPPPSISRGSRSSSWSCDYCREYDFKYACYKTSERNVRRWLCEETGSSRPECELDRIDVGNLLRMATRIKDVTVPSSVKESLVETIQGRKDALMGWHWDSQDHECAECGRFWSQADKGHKHHIKELERMLGMLEGAAKPRDLMALKSWR